MAGVDVRRNDFCVDVSLKGVGKYASPFEDGGNTARFALVDLATINVYVRAKMVRFSCS